MAKKDGVPAVFFTATEDSLRNAMENAVILDRAMESEKNHAAQIDTLLDYSFNAIVRIAPNRKILSVNSRMCDILEAREEDLTDRNVQAVFPELSDESLRRVFDRGEEYVLLMQINKVRMITELVPVWSSGHVESAVMTSHRVREEGVTRSPIDRHNTNLLMPAASSHFNNIVQESPSMKRTIELGKIFATSPFPVLLEAEAGLHVRNFAQSMHNIGPRRGRPYIEGDCRTMTKDAQMDRFFRDGGLLDTAGDGTLAILNIDSADERFFARLLPVFSRRRVKVICTSRVPVEELFRKGLIGEEAYSYLAALRIRIPPLRERPEDLEHFITLYFRRAYERQGRFHVMTKSAKEYLMSCLWPGNEVQVHVFAERLVLTSAKRSIDEISVRQAMDQFNHNKANDRDILLQNAGSSLGDHSEESGGSPARYLTYADRERRKIREALQDNGGNRQLTAKALGISTTTLWRRMQKYGIRSDEQ
jgi:transcriptional regulator with PAS, ATPase and Fis domain